MALIAELADQLTALGHKDLARGLNRCLELLALHEALKAGLEARSSRLDIGPFCLLVALHPVCRVKLAS